MQTLSSVGSATTVANRGIKLQSIGVAVRYHTPTEDHHTSRPIQGHKSPKKKKKKSLDLEYIECIEFFCRVLWLKSHILVKFHIVCRRFN